MAAMKGRLLFCTLLWAALPAVAQTPALTPHVTPIGFTINLDADWTEIDMSAQMAAARQQVAQAAISEVEKRGITCLEMPLTARHGNPPSMLTVVDLPWSCMGIQATEKDLPGFGMGALQNLRQQFEMEEPATSTFALGHHAGWTARAKATPRGTQLGYTIEVACTLVEKGSVCAMIVAADATTLSHFEQLPVVLDGTSFPALVPAGTYGK